MKAIFKNQVKAKAVGININSEKSDSLKKILEEFNVDYVSYDSSCGSQQIGYLCGFNGFSASDQSVEIDKEALLFSGMRSNILNGILDKMRKENIIVKLKAVVTEFNQKWTVSELLAELEKEHNIMNGGRKNGKE